MSSTKEFTIEENSPVSKVKCTSYKTLKNNVGRRNRVESIDDATQFKLRKPNTIIGFYRQTSSSFHEPGRVNEASNPFGYTPYDTGAVKSDFTGMLNSIPRQSSLLNTSSSKKHMKKVSSKFKIEQLLGTEETKKNSSK